MDIFKREAYQKGSDLIKEEEKEPKTTEEICRFLSKEFHPDKKGIESKELMIELNAAREEAKDGRPEDLQKIYDRFKKAKVDTYT